MKSLKEILYKVAIEGVSGSTDGEVTHIAMDSREVSDKGMFVAIKGTAMDGHDYIGKSIGAGAKYIVCEQIPEVLNKAVVYIQVDDSRAALGFIADNFYDNPSSKLNLVGITGTNGKTTVPHSTHHLFLCSSSLSWDILYTVYLVKSQGKALTSQFVFPR